MRGVAGSGDLVVHVRLGDYLQVGWALDPSYYLNIIESESFDCLHVLSDEPDHPYLHAFDRFRPVIPRLNELDAMIYLKNSPRIVLSQSTFGWWGAFLSSAQKVYFPFTESSLWSRRGLVDLIVDDEPRFVCAPARALRG